MIKIRGYENVQLRTFYLYPGRGVSMQDRVKCYNNSSYYTPCTILDSPDNILSKLNSVKVAPPTKGTLFFDSSSKFPRFKLQDSNYKRCIKLEKADLVIVSNDPYIEVEGRKADYKRNKCNYQMKIVEDLGEYFVIEERDYYASSFINTYSSKPNATLIDTLVHVGLLSKNYKIAYDGPCTPVSQMVYDLYDNIDNQLYTKVMTDNDLDSTLSSTFESLDTESLDSIREMLGSTDRAVVDMGLKLIPNYNVLEYPLSISTILRINNSRCTSSNVWNSTSVKQLRHTLQYTEPYSNGFPTCIAGVEKPGITYSDADKAYARNLITSQTEETVKGLIKNLEDSVKVYGIKINAEVQTV